MSGQHWPAQRRRGQRESKRHAPALLARTHIETLEYSNSSPAQFRGVGVGGGVCDQTMTMQLTKKWIPNAPTMLST